MALLTKCKFYFGVEITQDNNVLDFDEGSGEISVTIPVGVYSPKQISDKIASLLTAASWQYSYLPIEVMGYLDTSKSGFANLFSYGNGSALPTA